MFIKVLQLVIITSNKVKQTAKILIILTIILNQSCVNNDCENEPYFTPPSPLNFELVNKSTNENLFTNGTYESNKIEILNIADNSSIEYSFINEDDINIIQIGSIGWKSEIVEGSVKINGSEIFTFYVDAKRLSENCISYTKYDEIRIENKEYELDHQSGVYKILVDVKRYECIVGEVDSIVSSDQILGKWKITGARNPWFVNRFYDYSNENIIYNFLSNGILIVTGNENHKGAYANGEYNYVFKYDYFSDYHSPNEPKIWYLTIDDGLEWTYKSLDTLMQLGQSYTDMNDYCLKRED